MVAADRGARDGAVGEEERKSMRPDDLLLSAGQKGAGRRAVVPRAQMGLFRLVIDNDAVRFF